MSRKSNTGSKLANLSGVGLTRAAESPQVANTPHKKKQLEILIGEESVKVWDLLALGKTQKQVAKELGIGIATVNTRINKALEEIRGWAGRQAEDWRNAQLLIVAEQISDIIVDTMAKPIPRMILDDGVEVQEYSKAGYPLWDLSPQEAAKQRNMARVTLAKYLEHQAKLLDLTVERKEIQVDQKVAIGVYDFGTFDGAASMDDL